MVYNQKMRKKEKEECERKRERERTQSYSWKHFQTMYWKNIFWQFPKEGQM